MTTIPFTADQICQNMFLPDITPEQFEHVRKWIAALRSGRYQQGRNALRRRTGEGVAYCCLGVACDLYDSTKWDNEVYCLGSDYVMLPPEAVRAFFGLKAASGHFTFVSDKPVDPSKFVYEPLIGPVWGTSLDRLNDSAELSFEQIADVIEMHLGAVVAQGGK